MSETKASPLEVITGPLWEMWSSLDFPFCILTTTFLAKDMTFPLPSPPTLSYSMETTSLANWEAHREMSLLVTLRGSQSRRICTNSSPRAINLAGNLSATLIKPLDITRLVAFMVFKTTSQWGPPLTGSKPIIWSVPTPACDTRASMTSSRRTEVLRWLYSICMTTVLARIHSGSCKKD